MIVFDSVTKTYRGMTAPALDHVSFHVKPGSICGVVGLSGAGKSTLIRCMTGLERVDSGSIRIGSIDITALSGAELRKAQRNLGVVFQHFNLLQQRTALQNVMFPLLVAGVGKAEAARRARELLHLVGLTDKLNSYPSKLSGGQQQRVGIARALATNPKVLLCDEFTSALDPINTKSILELVKRLNSELGVTVLIVTHQLSIAQQACDSLIVIDEGHIVEDGPAQAVLKSPRSRILRAMVTTLAWS
ncbi:MAG: ATP-binding cassette domain-containing protein [Bacillota bacterium]|nr:ATP-binding cassette domain-containing protein [Bacillota bacterium]